MTSNKMHKNIINIESLDFLIENNYISTKKEFEEGFQKGIGNNFKSLGWIIRRGMMRNYIKKEEFSEYFGIISSVSDQKAGWALDNAIMQGWVGDEDTFLKYFGIISSVSNQKAGWALDNAITQGWILDESVFLKYLSMIFGVTGQKICFPIHQGMELKWIHKRECLLSILSKNINTADQGIGWAMRQGIKKNLLIQNDFQKLYGEIVHIQGQMAGWTLEIAIEKGWVSTKKDFLSCYNLGKTTERQHIGWSLIQAYKSQLISNQELILYYKEISGVIGQHAGWVLRFMLQTGITRSQNRFQEQFQYIENIKEQDMKWTLDIALENGYLTENQIQKLYGNILTIQGYNFDWLAYQILQQGKHQMFSGAELSRRYSNIDQQPWYHMIDDIYDGNLARAKKLVNHYAKTRKAYIGFVGVSLIKEGHIKTAEDFEDYFIATFHTPYQKIGIAISYAYKQNIISLHELQKYYELLQNVEGQGVGYLLRDIIYDSQKTSDELILEFENIVGIHGQNLGIALKTLVETGMISTKVYAKRLFSTISGIPGQAGEHFLDIASEKGWLSKSEYQRFFSLTEI